MAEITEPLLPPNETPETSKPLEPADDFDPKMMRRITPGLKRLIITVSVLFSFILGIPLIYKSVEIPLISKTNSFVSPVSYHAFIILCFLMLIFLPVSIDVLLAALREWRRYKQENNK